MENLCITLSTGYPQGWVGGALQSNPNRDNLHKSSDLLPTTRRGPDRRLRDHRSNKSNGAPGNPRAPFAYQPHLPLSANPIINRRITILSRHRTNIRPGTHHRIPSFPQPPIERIPNISTKRPTRSIDMNTHLIQEPHPISRPTKRRPPKQQPLINDPEQHPATSPQQLDPQADDVQSPDHETPRSQTQRTPGGYRTPPGTPHPTKPHEPLRQSLIPPNAIMNPHHKRSHERDQQHRAQQKLESSHERASNTNEASTSF